VKVGLTLPQGCDREFLGIDPEEAWRSTVEIAQYAEESGFESLWIYDHFQVDPPPEPAIVFEPVVELASLAMVTDRARLGHLVLAAAYRNPALTAKMISTIDVISGGRAVLGIGAGWKEDEWIAYGYGFPDAATRLGILEDHLEIITRMFQTGSASYQGRYAHVVEAIHEPKGVQEPRIPILIGGNGPKVTWRLAARFGDELNLDAMMPAEVAEAMPVIASRCEEIGRDPSTLPVSVHIWGNAGDVAPGGQRQERFLEYGEVGVDRIIVQGFVGVFDRPALESLVDDCAAAGLLN
jgi:F420-dependent oxidoreductase-like protein